MKPCPRCGKKTKPGYRYCLVCQGVIKREMKESGYLSEPLPEKRYRGKSYRESTHETKNGKDN